MGSAFYVFVILNGNMESLLHLEQRNELAIVPAHMWTSKDEMNLAGLFVPYGNQPHWLPQFCWCRLLHVGSGPAGVAEWGWAVARLPLPPCMPRCTPALERIIWNPLWICLCAVSFYKSRETLFLCMRRKASFCKIPQFTERSLSTAFLYWRLIKTSSLFFQCNHSLEPLTSGHQ